MNPYRVTLYNDELYHHGIVGMKWGIRRYQNQDGNLTPAGKKRYNKLNNTSVDRYVERTKRSAKVIEKVKSKYNSGQSLSTKEVKRALVEMARVAKERKLMDIRTEEIKKGFDYFENVMEREGLLGGLPAQAVAGINYREGLKKRSEVESEFHKNVKMIRDTKVDDDVASPSNKKLVELMEAVRQEIDPEGKPFRKTSNNESDVENLSKRLTGKSEDGKSSDYKKAALENARKNDRYDMNFLEATQNDEYDNQTMLKEYEKYLDDPDKYMRTH